VKKTKQLKRQEAMERQNEYNILDVASKIKRAKSRRGESKKELSKLVKLS